MSLHVSFGSTYKINHSFNLNNAVSLGDLIDKCEQDKIPYNLQYGRNSIMTTIAAADSQDKDVETMCARLGINYKKYSTDSLMTPQAIMCRVAQPPKGMQMVKIDADKLEKLIASQHDNNIGHCEKDYKKYYLSDTDFMLKSGDEIPASTLYINPEMGKDNMLEYIKRFGKERINPDSIYINFSQRTDKPDHCVFFAMKDRGMTEIPVYMNQDSYEVANALGIVKR